MTRGARRWVDEERARVRAQLREAHAEYDVLRADWIAGRIERGARDAAARRLVERVTKTLCAVERTEEPR